MSYARRGLVVTAQIAYALVFSLTALAHPTGASATVSGKTRSSSVAPCATSRLVVWLNTSGDGAAGSIYYKLELTNASDHACTITGYPGVSAVDLGGRQIGGPASRIASPTATVRLGAGDTATAMLRVVEAGNFPAASCRPVSAAGVRVYPPNQKASKIVPIPFQACASSASVILSVSAAAV